MVTRKVGGTMTRTGKVALLCLTLAASTGRPARSDEVQVTIYNSDFALVKESRTLTLKQGTGETRFSNVTSLLEPDSVVLRDRKNPDGLRILEQDYEGDPLSEETLLKRSEGKTLQFRVV